MASESNQNTDTKDLYRGYTDALEWEAERVDQRTTWLITCQSILFAAYALGLFESSKRPDYLGYTFLIVVSLVGIISSRLIYRSIQAAHNTMDELIRYLQGLTRDEARKRERTQGRQPTDADLERKKPPQAADPMSPQVPRVYPAYFDLRVLPHAMRFGLDDPVNQPAHREGQSPELLARLFTVGWVLVMVPTAAHAIPPVHNAINGAFTCLFGTVK